MGPKKTPHRPSQQPVHGSPTKRPHPKGGPKAAPVAKQPTEKKRKLIPVTLLSGFLGSGKTSLMKHILQNREGLRVAVIMNEITEVNLDVQHLQGTKLLESKEKVVEMANGCICCTLREDLLLQLRELARSGDFDAVLIESSGIAEPMQVAETFFVDTNDGNVELQMEAPLDNCVTVIDASMVQRHMVSLDSIDTLDPRADTSNESNTDIAGLLFSQLEFANVILLNKVDLLGGANKAEHQKRVEELVTLVKKINPHAQVIPSTHSQVSMDKILRTRNFSLEFASKTQNWMVDIKSGVKHVPETLEYGISNFFFTSDKPFHPQRLYDWLGEYFLLKQVQSRHVADSDDDEADNEDEEFDEEMEEGSVKKSPPQDEEPKGFVQSSSLQAGEEGKHDEKMTDNGATPNSPDGDTEQEQADTHHAESIAESNKSSKHETEEDPELEKRVKRYGNLFRSKGYLWIGSPQKLLHVGEWSQAGSLLTLSHAGMWSLAQAEHNNKPRQMLAFIGQDIKHSTIKEDLETLLMTDEEMNMLKSYCLRKLDSGGGEKAGGDATSVTKYRLDDEDDDAPESVLDDFRAFPSIRRLVGDKRATELMKDLVRTYLMDKKKKTKPQETRGGKPGAVPSSSSSSSSTTHSSKNDTSTEKA